MVIISRLWDKDFQIEKANKRLQLLVFSGNLLDPCLIEAL